MTDRQLKKQGNLAEKEVSIILHSLGANYHVFDNVLLKTSKGTTQIDHVVISPFGIFVIETKSHKGMIFGNCYDKNWTQVLFKGKVQQNNTFYSPYKQNYGHLRNLYKLFNLDYSYFLGLIVFTNDSVDLSRLQCPNALYAKYLVSTIMSYGTVVLNNYQVDTACALLQDANIQSDYQNRKHNNYVNSLKN